MTYLHSVPSDFENVFQLPPGVLVPLGQPASGNARTRVAETLVAARGLAVAVLRSTGEPGKASPIRGGGRTAKRMRR